MKKHVLVISILLGIASFNFINLQALLNYGTQAKPNYINKDNTPFNNPITDKGATLGRVLFYDKFLSANNSLACAGCHMQQFAFGDTATVSKGHLGGFTTRHAMRLVNARFGIEQKFFWNERASSLEDQTTHPLKDAVEMGWSGTMGQGNMDSLIKKMRGISYYKVLFPFVFGDSSITETRIQFALAQFIRSMQSFDSKFDQGLAQTPNLVANFPNYTAQENQGKALFLLAPNAGGAGCQGCHAAPEFDIDPNTKNNGVIAVAGSNTSVDLMNTRAPSLRNVFNQNGQLNGPLMHNGNFKSFLAVVNHYNSVPQGPANTNLDPRLQGPGSQLNLTQAQKDALIAFIKTLSGSAIYTDERWSDPFDAPGVLSMISGISELGAKSKLSLTVFPSIVQSEITVGVSEQANYYVMIRSINGALMCEKEISSTEKVDVSSYANGLYFVEVINKSNQSAALAKFIKK